MIAIGQANTAKLLAYLLPALVHTSNRESVANDPITLILTHNSTRINTIANEIQKLKISDANAFVRLYGDHTKDDVNETLRTADWKTQKILIAHPESLVHMLGILEERGIHGLKEVTFVAIDQGKLSLDAKQFFGEFFEPHFIIVYSNNLADVLLKKRSENPSNPSLELTVHKILNAPMRKDRQLVLCGTTSNVQLESQGIRSALNAKRSALIRPKNFHH